MKVKETFTNIEVPVLIQDVLEQYKLSLSQYHNLLLLAGIQPPSYKNEDLSTKIPFTWIQDIFVSLDKRISDNQQEILFKNRRIFAKCLNSNKEEYENKLQLTNYMVKSFSFDDLICAGSDIERNHLNVSPINKRVAFIRQNSIVPFGTVGIVFDYYFFSGECWIISDTPLPFRSQDTLSKKRIFHAFISDLYLCRTIVYQAGWSGNASAQNGFAVWGVQGFDEARQEIFCWMT